MSARVIRTFEEMPKKQEFNKNSRGMIVIVGSVFEQTLQLFFTILIYMLTTANHHNYINNKMAAIMQNNFF